MNDFPAPATRQLNYERVVTYSMANKAGRSIILVPTSKFKSIEEPLSSAPNTILMKISLPLPKVFCVYPVESRLSFLVLLIPQTLDSYVRRQVAHRICI